LAGGNPLLVTELLNAGGRTASATVQDLILRRLNALPAPARRLAQLVAVIPTRAEAAVVAGAADLVDACVDAGVLVPVEDGVAYRHELLRGAVEGSLSPAGRAALHQQALSVLAGVPGVDPGRIVHHAVHAGDTAAVLRFGQLAADGAARQGAHREAAAHYRAAAEHADTLPGPARAQLLEAYAFQAYLAGFGQEGLQARRKALLVREELGDIQYVGENLRWISRSAWWIGDAEQAWEAAVQAVAVLESGEPSRQLAMAYSNLSQLHMLGRDHDAAVEWGERARTLADRFADVETSLHATINVHSARLQHGADDAAEALLAAHDRAATAGLVDHAARALVNLASTLVELAQFTAAAPVLDQALAYAERQDLDGYVQYLLGVRAESRVAGCDFDGALTDADASLARQSRMGVAVVPALVARGRVQSARGDAAAWSTLDEASRQAEPTGELQWIGPVAAARSEHYLLCGDPEAAAREARHGLDLAIAAEHPVYIGELGYRLWRAGGPQPLPVTAAPPYQLMVSGDFAGAAAEWARRGAGYARIQALAGGDLAAAGEALRALDELGAVRAAQRLRAELRGRGFTRVPRGPRRATSANVAGLTPRQLDVLGLLTEGLSNAEIAVRLSLSAKTVEHHISAVLEKLGVANRGQAAAVAHRLNLTGGAAS
jgi:DNA-binding CsgD family transcriptional regulator